MIQILVFLILMSGSLAAKNPPPVELVWHATGLHEQPLDTRGADRPFNPASVTKIATTLWALELLGPGFRFETQVGFRGRLDRDRGVLDGDLMVYGGGDPDFHIENAWILASRLNRAGLREVHGDLLVSDDFWIGWEGGSARRNTDSSARTRMMANRLRDALDPQRWNKQAQEGIREFLLRSGRGESTNPSVVVRGRSGEYKKDRRPRGQILVTHRSNPLVRILKRFNSFSNNDIERLGAHLGDAAHMTQYLAGRWEIPGASIRFETLSGLGSNRMTSRQVVRLLRDLQQVCRKHDLEVHDILPRAGCDPGTLKNFSRLSGDRSVRPLVAKTGTLTETDGGVVVLAGFAPTDEGTLVFSIAAPGSGRRLRAARSAQQRWLLGLLERTDPPAPQDCGAAVVHSDHDVQLTEPDDKTAVPK